MKKGITHRIAFYTRKVAELGSIHPSKVQPRSFKYRHQRLMQYKDRMHELINEEQAREM